MIFKGFKFSILLQFAIGPVCIFIFQMASLNGFYAAEVGVLGVTLVDGLFIIVSILGISSIIDKKTVRVYFKVFGTSILFVFGFSTILNQFKMDSLASLSLYNLFTSNNVFTQAIILAASNPLTAIFWTGVFSAKVAEEGMKRHDIYLFGFGSLLSTIFFLSLVACVGSFANAFFPISLIRLLNIIVGFLLIYFAVRIILKKV